MGAHSSTTEKMRGVRRAGTSWIEAREGGTFLRGAPMTHVCSDPVIKPRSRRARTLVRSIGALLALGVLQQALPAKRAGFSGPTASQPLALSADGDVLAVANPDNNSVTFFDTSRATLRLIDEVTVGREPNGVALSPDGREAYVANTLDGTVSVLKLNGSGRNVKVDKVLDAGTEPYGVAVTPNGDRVYVTNARSNSVTVINARNNDVIDTIDGVGIEPRGLAITNDGDDRDDNETVLVTQFLSLPAPGKIDGADDAKVAFVTMISTETNQVTGQIQLDPIANTGFNAAGDALARIPPGTSFTFPTGAYPNQLNNVAIKGHFAYVPNTGASPNGPVRFNVNTQSLLHVIDSVTGADAHRTINMHQAVANQTSTARTFITQPWAMAFKHGANEGYVISAASNLVVKVAVDGSTGAPTVLTDPLDPTRVLQIPTGRNPRGIVVNEDDTRAYVMNYISRDVTVIDLTGPREQVMATVTSAVLPTPGTVEAKVHIGKELYNTSIGVFDPATAGGAPIVGRMSAAGWGSCASCHPNGLSDNVVWIFATGPRRTIPQHTDFDQTDPARGTQRALNWSAINDEEEDFELNIRNVSGGAGLIVLADGVTQDPNVAPFVPLANAGRNQLKVRGVPAWDAIKAFVQFGIRAPVSPVSSQDPAVVTGRALFGSAGCTACHGGSQWTRSRIDYTPPPGAGLLSNTQLIGQLREVGTFNPAAFNEVRANAAPPLGADGFVPPSLISIFAFPRTFFHNGAADSLAAALNNVTHRSAGTGGVDTLTSPTDRQRLVDFLLSIDAGTVPFP
jgi:YVTN family beta-propeller protein